MNPMRNLLRQTIFLETVFISMGKLAKATGASLRRRSSMSSR